MGYRQALKDAGFDIIDGTHPCVPIMLYDEHKAARMAQKLYELGIYAVSFTYPVVPKGRARIRTQVSAAHTKEDLNSPSVASSKPAARWKKRTPKLNDFAPYCLKGSSCKGQTLQLDPFEVAPPMGRHAGLPLR